jgi:hypothetical protein
MLTLRGVARCRTCAQAPYFDRKYNWKSITLRIASARQGWGCDLRVAGRSIIYRAIGGRHGRAASRVRPTIAMQ